VCDLNNKNTRNDCENEKIDEEDDDDMNMNNKNKNLLINLFLDLSNSAIIISQLGLHHLVFIPSDVTPLLQLAPLHLQEIAQGA
jgi:hypothetical protein